MTGMRGDEDGWQEVNKKKPKKHTEYKKVAVYLFK